MTAVEEKKVAAVEGMDRLSVQTESEEKKEFKSIKNHFQKRSKRSSKIRSTSNAATSTNSGFEKIFCYNRRSPPGHFYCPQSPPGHHLYLICPTNLVHQNNHATTTSTNNIGQPIRRRGSMTSGAAFSLVLLLLAACGCVQTAEGAVKRICWSQNPNNPGELSRGRMMMDDEKRRSILHWPLLFLLLFVVLIAYPAMYVSMSNRQRAAMSQDAQKGKGKGKGKKKTMKKISTKKTPAASLLSEEENEEEKNDDGIDGEYNSEIAVTKLAALMKAQKKLTEEASPPKIYRPAMSSKKVRPGDTIKFNVPITVKNKKPITAIWELNGIVLQHKVDRCRIKTEGKRTIIEIRKAERRDEGKIRLTVKNQDVDMEGDIAEAKVAILRVPKPPRGPVLVQNIQSDGCTFKFRPPSQSDCDAGIPPIHQYVVEAVPNKIYDPRRPMKKVGQFPAVVNSRSGMIELPVTRMMPANQGPTLFQIRAVNSVGASIPLSITTPINITESDECEIASSALPPAPLGPIVAENVGPDGCKLKCFPPPDCHDGSEPTHEYIVEAKPAGSDDRSMQEVGRFPAAVDPASGMVELTVKGLLQESCQGLTDFQIRAGNLGGTSKPLKTSTPINIAAEPVQQLPPAAPATGPTDLAAPGMVEPSTKLLPETGGPTDCQIRSGNYRVGVSDPLSTSTPINIPAAEPEKTKPVPLPVPPIGSIVGENIGSTGCTLKCYPPPADNGPPIREYIVEARPASSEGPMQVVGRFPVPTLNPDSGKIELTIKGLPANQGPTDFQIRSVNSVGVSTGAWSRTAIPINIEKEKKPPRAPIGPILVQDIGPDSCTLKCAPPKQRSGRSVEEYVVEARIAADDDKDGSGGSMKEVGRFPVGLVSTKDEIVIPILGLSPNQGPTDFRIRSVNGAGVSDPLTTDSSVRIGRVVQKPGRSIEECIVETKPPAASADEHLFKPFACAPALDNNNGSNSGRSPQSTDRVSEPSLEMQQKSINISAAPFKAPDVAPLQGVESTDENWRRSIRVRQGEPIKVGPVPISGFPTPTAVWILNGNPLTGDSGDGRCRITRTPDLAAVEISAAEPKDAGKLELLLTNAAGQKAIPFNVTVIRKPDPPVGPLTIQRKPPDVPDGCNLAWNLPSNDGGVPIEEYVIEAKGTDDSSFREVGRVQAKNVQGDSPSYQVQQGLKPGQKYAFRVRAINKEGLSSEPLETVEPLTLAEPAVAPTIAPNALHDVTVSAGDLIVFSVPIQGEPMPSVTWTLNESPLEDGDQDGRCSLRLTTDNQAVFEIKDAHPIKDAGKLRLTLRNATGSASCEAMINIIAKPGIPEGPLTVKDVNKEGCTLTWSPPKIDGIYQPINDYGVEARKVGGSEPGEQEEEFREVGVVLIINPEGKQRLEYNVAGLPSPGQYEFQVKAKNEAGQSEPLRTENPVDIQDEIGDPGKAGQPTAIDVTADSITLRWDTPVTDGGAPIEKYIVEKRDHTTKEWVPYGETDDPTPETTIRNLRSKHRYQFRVLAVNKAQRHGAPSEPMDKTRTLEPATPTTPTPSNDASKLQPSEDSSSPRMRENESSSKKIKLPTITTSGEQPESNTNIEAPSGSTDDLEADKKSIVAIMASGEPGRPGKPTVSKLATARIGVKWDPPSTDGGSPIETYIVERRHPETKDWDPVQEVDGNNTETDLPNIKPGHTYQFRVRAVNKAGKRGKASEPTEKIRTPRALNKPFIMASSFQDQTLNAPEELRLEAVVGGDPTPDVFWTRDGETVEEADGASFYSKSPDRIGGETTLVAGLTVPNTKREDQGDYQLTAINTEGEASATCHVNILSPPSAPVGPLIVYDLEDTGCKLAWKPPEDSGGHPVTGYEVERREPWSEDPWTPVGRVEAAADGAGQQPHGGVEPPNQMMKVTGCIWMRPYDFRVIPVNKLGRGKPLETDEPTTIAKPEPPEPGAPFVPPVKKTRHRKEQPIIDKDATLTFDAPVTTKLIHNFALTNRSPIQRMGWCVRTNVPQRLEIKPPFGILDPKEKCVLSVIVQPFTRKAGVPVPKKDRFTILWIKTPDPTVLEFDRNWLKDESIVSKRKNVLIHYNQPGGGQIVTAGAKSAEVENPPVPNPPSFSINLSAPLGEPPSLAAAAAAGPGGKFEKKSGGSAPQRKSKKKKKKKLASQRDKKKKASDAAAEGGHSGEVKKRKSSTEKKKKSSSGSTEHENDNPTTTGADEKQPTVITPVQSSQSSVSSTKPSGPKKKSASLSNPSSSKQKAASKQ